MSNIKSTLAMLTLGGVAAAGAASAATPITVTFDISGTGNPGLTPVNLVGGTGTDLNPQFYYGNLVVGEESGPNPVLVSGPEVTSFTKGLFASQYGAIGPASSTNPGFPTFSDVVDGGFISPIEDEPTYVQLAFLNGSQEYVGYAYIDPSANLETITYEAVPEPAAWALLIAGVGLAGAAVRTRRRKELAQAA